MKRISMLIVGVALLMSIGYALAQNTNVHDKSFDNKSILKINFDDPNTYGVATVQPKGGNTGTTTVTIPTTTATLMNNNLHDMVNSEGGINWVDAGIVSTGINWMDVQAVQKTVGLTTGINWNYLDPNTGGVNWMAVTKTGADGAIVCIKGGQLGKCSSTFSSAGAGSCTCI